MKKKFRITNPKLKKAAKKISDNSDKILLGLGIGTSIGACIKIAKDAPEAKAAIDELEEYWSENDIWPEKKAKELIEKAKVAGPIMAPGIILEVTSVCCTLGSHRASSKKIGALATAYKLSEETLKEYKSKVMERMGEKAAQEIKEEICSERLEKAIEEAPSKSSDLTGMYPCYDRLTDRWFYTNDRDIAKAEMIINQRLRTEMWVNLNDLYDILGLRRCPVGDLLGWNIDKVGERGLDIGLSSIVDDNGRPCLCIDYDESLDTDFSSF